MAMPLLDLTLPGKPLLLHGVIILWTGLLAGFAFWAAVLRKAADERVRAWRVAHGTLLMDAILMLAVAPVLPHLALSPAAARVTVWALILSAYGFVFALGVGAWAGVRGLAPRPVGVNTVFFAGHVVGVTGVLVAAALLLYGAAGAM
jgi:hypothetical protein